MRIGIISLGKFDKEEGGTVVLKNVIKYIPKLDFDNEYIVITCKESKAISWAKEFGVPYIEILDCKHNTSLIRVFEIFLLPCLLKNLDIDAYLCPNNYAPLFSKKPIFLIFQRRLFYFPEIDDMKRMLVKKIFLIPTLKKASLVFVASQFHKKIIIKHLPELKNKTKVAYLGVEIESITKSKKFEKLIDRKNNIVGLFVSVLRPYKNLEVLIEAIKILKNKYHVNNFKLVVVGHFPKGKYKNLENYELKIYNTIKNYELEKDIIFLGSLPHTEVLYIYKNVDIFLFPSKFEGFGLPLVESMKMGLPIIASNATVIPEIVNGAAILINPDNPDLWAKNIYKLIVDLNLRKEIGKKGLEVSQKYNWKYFALTIINYIKNYNK